MTSPSDGAVETKPHGAGERSIHLRKYKLVVLNGDQRGRELVVSGDAVSIGKSDDNTLVLSDPTVSRRHCEIVWDGHGPLLRDLGSTNGTFLNSSEVRAVYLMSGAVITVGAINVRFGLAEQRFEILPSDSDHLGQMVGASLPMREIYGFVEQLAPTDATVLLSGETGTGKDLLARTIHAMSARAERPFVVVDCGAVAGGLIESELFGHERGAFTGAANTRQGAFELAQGGTIFLDELGELSLELQPKLLRVLEQREIRRVGGNRTIPLDVRVIAASKRDLHTEVVQGNFREDLYFRISVVPLRVPPLRERLEDIPALLAAFVRSFDLGDVDLPPGTVEMLMSHDWPGNVRELRNVFERGMHLFQHLGAAAFSVEPITSAEVRRTPSVAVVTDATPSSTDSLWPSFDATASYRDNKGRWDDEFERRYIRWLLERSGGNVTRAAREASMDRKYLRKLVRKHGLQGNS